MRNNAMRDKDTHSLLVDHDELMVLALALRSLSTLRLDPHLAFSSGDAPAQVVEYMNRSVNGFKNMCCDLDSVIDDPGVLIADLMGRVDLTAGEQVYQSLYDKLKCLSEE